MMKENLAANIQVKQKYFPIFTIISVTLLAITLCLSIASWRFDSWKNPEHKLTLSESFHIGFGRASQYAPFGYITFFSDDSPYGGSIISLETGEKPTYERIWYFWIYGFSHVVYTDKLGRVTEFMYCCDLPGIYFRYFESPSFIIWTLTVGLWLPLLLFSLLPSIQILKWKRKREKVKGKKGE